VEILRVEAVGTVSSRTNKAFKGTMASFLQYAVFIVLQVLLAPLVLRLAGQEVLGTYSIVMQIVGYGILLDLGFSVALSRYLAQAYGREEQTARFSELFSIGRAFLLVTNAVLAVAICAAAVFIDGLVVASSQVITQARLALYILALWTLIRTPLSLYNHALMATQNMAAANIISIFGNISRLVLSLCFVYTGFGLIGLIAAQIASEAFALIIQRKYFRKQFRGYSFGWKVTNYKLFKEILSFGMKYWGVNLSVVLFLGSDSIIVGNLYGAGAASVFYTTKIPAFLLFQFIFRLSDNAAPAANELYSRGELQTLRSAYLRILRYSLFFALPLALGIIAFNEGVISAWVGRAQFAGNIMSIALACFVVTQVFNHINAMITLAAGRMSGWPSLSLVTSMACLALSYWLGKTFGMQWIMVAIAIMDIPAFVFLFRRALNSLNVSFLTLLQQVLRPSLAVSLPLCILVTVVRVMGPIASLWTLILYIGLFASLGVIAVATMGLTPSERILLRSRYDSYISHSK
jgi:O-antigen/teichoic acid export membrane protein